MDLTTFEGALAFVQTQGYIIIFLIMIIEGPIITTAASFAASLGYLNIWIIFALAVLGDLTGDTIYYAIGYFGRHKIIERYEHLFKASRKLIARTENHFKNHLGKTLLIAKITPFAVPTLILAGASKVPLKKYITWCMIIILPKTIFFTATGFFFGYLTNSLLKYYNDAGYVLVALVVGVVLIYWGSRKIFNMIAK